MNEQKGVSENFRKVKAMSEQLIFLQNVLNEFKNNCPWYRFNDKETLAKLANIQSHVRIAQDEVDRGELARYDFVAQEYFGALDQILYVCLDKIKEIKKSEGVKGNIKDEDITSEDQHKLVEMLNHAGPTSEGFVRTAAYLLQRNIEWAEKNGIPTVGEDALRDKIDFSELQVASKDSKNSKEPHVWLREETMKKIDAKAGITVDLSIENKVDTKHGIQ